MATFITSKGIGETITIRIATTSGYWKANHDGVDSPVYISGISPSRQRSFSVANANGEFTIIPCDAAGTPSGSITHMILVNNQLTSFSGTGLTSLTTLMLQGNQLTSLDGFILPTSLTSLNLANNQLTSFDGTGLSSLTYLNLDVNQLTSVSNLPSTLYSLYLSNNQLTSLDLTGFNVLQYLYVHGNPSINTPSINDSLLALLAANELANDWNYGEFGTQGGRTSAGTPDYEFLVSRSWYVGGVELIPSGNSKLRIKGVFTVNGNM
jgi:hypothetical protein